MWPLRFVMPHDPSMRPAWMIRLGLFLYDHLARREVLPGSRTRRPAPPSGRRAAEAGVHARASSIPTAGSTMRGWSCSTPSTPPSAAPTVLTRTALRRRAARRRRTGRLRLEGDDGRERDGRARARSSTPPGPWAAQFLRRARRTCRGARRCAWSRAATSSCRKLFDHDHAYIFQNPDKRIIFAIPYEGDFTLIGTTDVEHHGRDRRGAHRRRRDRLPVRAGEPLFRAAGRRRRDVVWSYSGVRPLLDDEAGRPVGGDARLPARARHRRGRRCSRLGRQDHDLPQARRGGRRPAAPALPGTTRGAWTRERRRCPAAT